MSIIRQERPVEAADLRRVNERALGRPDEADPVDALRLHGSLAAGPKLERSEFSGCPVKLATRQAYSRPLTEKPSSSSAIIVS
jgi:hypothetical protein